MRRVVLRAGIPGAALIDADRTVHETAARLVREEVAVS
jgi:hypothetical protein